ncbi:MAG: FtsX-like permease family protein [Vicinamibacterales bacterium]
MTMLGVALRGLWHYRRTHAAVVAGVACAVAVLAGASLVGSSVRASLTGLVTDRLGRTDLVVGAENPFRDTLGERLRAHPSINATAPMFVLEGMVTHQPSSRRAGKVNVYGVDARFFQFHGVTANVPSGNNVLLSPDLATELGAVEADALVLRVTRPTDIPLDSLHSKKDDVGKSIRLRVKGTLPRASMGEFSLTPSQGPVRAIFVDLARVQRDLEQPGRANALLLSRAPGASVDDKAFASSVGEVLEASDLGISISSVSSVSSASSVVVESSSGLLSDDLVSVVNAVSGERPQFATPVLSWLANRMTVRDKTTPYSLVAGLGPGAAADSAISRMLEVPDSSPGQTATAAADPPIVLNDWTARDLSAKVGDALEMEYYRWLDEGRLVTERATFRVAGIVPIQGLAADRHLAPPYPGITDSESVADWDPPFPIDLKLVRPVDEDYWDKYRTTAKAFVPIATAQKLWGTRHGKVSSIRLPVSVDSPAETLAGEIVRKLGVEHSGLTIADVRTQNLSASAGATDFGAYFSYFSFFLVVSALLLTALFFRLGVEQRLREIGVLRATGFSLRTIQRLFVIEGALVAVAGAVVGAGLAVAWASLMMYGLRTWWVGAVGTTALTLHVDAGALAIGAAGGVAASLICIAWTVRGLSRHSPRELLAGSAPSAGFRRPSRAYVWAGGSLALAIGVTVATTAGLVPAAAGFFGAGALVLVSGLAALSGRLKRRAVGVMHGTGTSALVRFGWQNAAWKPGRSLTSTGLVAAAAFLLVSVDAFRKDTGAASGREGGTGGFALIAESVLPLVNDPSDSNGREALGLTFDRTDAALSGVSLVAARLRPGDDASCLNLYKPKQPRVVGVPDGIIEQKRFTFAASLADSDPERENPWRLLKEPQSDAAIPAIVDATSLQYVLHAAVGDEVVIDAETARPIRLRIVGSLADSVLQGEILIADSAFTALFPDVAGYRMLLVEVSPERVAEIDSISATLEERLEPYGLDAQRTLTRLEAYHRVENTYLSTFQTLGGLGLILGTVGLAAVTIRNVFERRRELALLASAGYRVGELSVLVVSETLALVMAGLFVGVSAALVSIAPVIIERGGRPPALSMIWLGAVVVSGVVAALVATRSVRRLPLVASLRSE